MACQSRLQLGSGTNPNPNPNPTPNPTPNLVLSQVFELIAATRNSNTFVALTLLVAVLYRGGG